MVRCCYLRFKPQKLKSEGHFELVSRDALLLVNNLLLVATTATILLGTLYPLVIDALGLGKISVGPPYFNGVFIPLTAPLAFLSELVCCHAGDKIAQNVCGNW